MPRFALAIFVACLFVSPVRAHAPSGASFTTTATGSEVNANQYAQKEDVYDDTPNPGGVYKVWVTFIEDYGLGGCPLTSTGADCGVGKFGFVPAHSKTDNFKVKAVPVREIDGFFIDQTGQNLSGLQMTWIDTLGVSNNKWSYYVAFWDATEAHVEAVEEGIHQIVVDDQPGCTVGDVDLQEYTYTSGSFRYVGSGPQMVPVKINGNHYQNHFVKVYCQP